MSAFNELIEVIFDNLPIKELEVNCVRSELLTPQFYTKIKNCSSLRKVEFNKLADPHTQLNAIESNPNVKLWKINFRYDDIIDSVKERLQKMRLDRNDNSLLFYNCWYELTDTPQLAQQFEISPVLYY